MVEFIRVDEIKGNQFEDADVPLIKQTHEISYYGLCPREEEQAVWSQQNNQEDELIYRSCITYESLCLVRHVYQTNVKCQHLQYLRLDVLFICALLVVWLSGDHTQN